MSIWYQDWRKDVNALMCRKIPEKKILDAIMNSVEGGPGETAEVAYEKGKGSLNEVLDALDTVHGRSISYNSTVISALYNNTMMRMYPYEFYRLRTSRTS